MSDILQDLLKILNEIEVKGRNNLARLYNSIDIVEQLLSKLPETPQVELVEEDATDGAIELE